MYFFTVLNGTDIDISDASNMYFYAVSADGYVVPECVGVFCVQRNGRVYPHRTLVSHRLVSMCITSINLFIHLFIRVNNKAPTPAAVLVLLPVQKLF